MKNDLFSIGGFTIHGYGLMIGIGFLAAYLLSDHRAKKKGLDGDHVLGLGMWVIVIGLAGAKFLYYITTIDEIIKDPGLLLDIANGFVVYGGIIGGILGGYAYCRKYRLDFLKYADLIRVFPGIWPDRVFSGRMLLWYGDGRGFCHNLPGFCLRPQWGQAAAYPADVQRT